ncbi:hypothetical protein [Herbidospora cretacea]|uniref:hypothetical protein n=1 Tax=Herbidospora cretacea TaxID=28444 RepID=UPI000773D965|nr:hypothetical protein [Herbidospora cretacea]
MTENLVYERNGYWKWKLQGFASKDMQGNDLPERYTVSLGSGFATTTIADEVSWTEAHLALTRFIDEANEAMDNLMNLAVFGRDDVEPPKKKAKK